MGIAVRTKGALCACDNCGENLIGLEPDGYELHAANYGENIVVDGAGGPRRTVSLRPTGFTCPACGEPTYFRLGNADAN